jgi:large subunit ribosomal protein L5
MCAGLCRIAYRVIFVFCWLKVPKLEKITVNCGIGDAQQNSKGLEEAMKNMTIITAQRPVKTVAKDSVASFKVREGNTLGIKVTLRGKVHYMFLYSVLICKVFVFILL